MRPAMLCAMLAATLATGGLVACGDEDMSADEKQIRATLKKALTSTEPATCRTHFTDNFLLQATDETTVEGALRDCRRDLKDDQAKAVEIKRVKVRGTRADAVVRTEGGDLPFEAANIALRRPEGEWQLHSLTGGTLDRPRFFRVGREELTTPPDAMDDDTASCVLRALKPVSDERIVAAFYVDADAGLIRKPAVICGLRSALDEDGVSERVQRCVAARLRRDLDARGGEKLADGLTENSASARRTFRRILTGCT